MKYLEKIKFILILTLLILVFPVGVNAQTGTGCDEEGEACCAVAYGYKCAGDLECSDVGRPGGVCRQPSGTPCDQVGEACCSALGEYRCDADLECSDPARSGGTCRKPLDNNHPCDELEEACCSGYGGYRCDGGFACSDIARGGTCIVDPNAGECNEVGETCCTTIGGGFCKSQVLNCDRASNTCIERLGNIVDIKYPVCYKGQTSGAFTAFGCIPFEVIEVAATFAEIGVGVGGGLAFILLAYAAYKYMLSGGNPDKLADAKGQLTAVLAGLLLLVFSGFILRILGVNILGIF